MKQWVVISGKGGTGKTCVTAALAAMATAPVLADCDVDAADLHLLVQPEPVETHEFFAGVQATIDPAQCSGCKLCQALCVFKAIQPLPYVERQVMRIDETACEGCTVCVRFCPDRAIATHPNHCGTWYHSESRLGHMIHAHLFPGSENSGKLVSTVRKEAEKQGRKQGNSLVLIDGPPGVGCPVISSLTGVDLAILVTEPSPSGRHDLLRVAELTAFMEIPCAIIINKWDLNKSYSDNLKAELNDLGHFVAGQVRYDENVYNALSQGQSVVEYTDIGAAEDMHNIWERLTAYACESGI